MKEKGFTLIELLAVIVILAIIALIATPVILNIINDAKEETQKTTVKNYAKAVENAIAKEMLHNANFEIAGEYEIKDGNIYKKEENSAYNLILTVEVDGDKPTSGTLKIEGKRVISIIIIVFGDNFEARMGENGNVEIIVDTNGCKLVSGNLGTIGSQVKCGTEYFYVIEATRETVSMLAQKNITLTSSPRQSSSAGRIKEADYHSDYFGPYSDYLQSLGLTDVNVGFPSANLIISFSTVETDGSYLFPSNSDWVTDIDYWVGNFEYAMDSRKLRPISYYNPGYDLSPALGIRPLVAIKKSEIG